MPKRLLVECPLFFLFVCKILKCNTSRQASKNMSLKVENVTGFTEWNSINSNTKRRRRKKRGTYKLYWCFSISCLWYQQVITLDFSGTLFCISFGIFCNLRPQIRHFLSAAYLITYKPLQHTKKISMFFFFNPI